MEYVVKWTNLQTNEVHYTGTNEDQHWTEEFARGVARSGTISGQIVGEPEMKAVLSLKNKVNRYKEMTGGKKQYDTGDAAEFYTETADRKS